MSASGRNPARGRRRLTAFGRDCDGTTAVEFAFILPVFILMLFGVFEYGWSQHCLSSVRYALEKASRALLLDPTLTQASLQTLVKNQLTGAADPNVTVTLSVATGTGGKIASLTATYNETIGVPTLVSYPIKFQTTVQTPLPAM